MSRRRVEIGELLRVLLFCTVSALMGGCIREVIVIQTGDTSADVGAVLDDGPWSDLVAPSDVDAAMPSPDLPMDTRSDAVAEDAAEVSLDDGPSNDLAEAPDANVPCVSGTCAEQRSCRTAGTAGCGLVEIDGGTFDMGAESPCVRGDGGALTPTNCAPDESSPVQRNVIVSSFAMDTTEVTVARFRQYWNSSERMTGSLRSTPIPYRRGQISWPAWSASFPEPNRQGTGLACNWTPAPASPSLDDHPINCVNYWTAQEFCVWDGGRLPTEAEWEYAARGRPLAMGSEMRGRLYPWGDEEPRNMPCDRAWWDGCGGEDGAQTRRVRGLAASGGIYDLAGNVAEWTADIWRNYGSAGGCRWAGEMDPLCSVDGVNVDRVARNNGSDPRALDAQKLRAAYRFNAPVVGPGDAGVWTTSQNDLLGFRCVRSR